MWAIARYDLGMAESEVWWLTLRQFAALVERHRVGIRRQAVLFGTVCATVAEVNRDPEKRSDPFTWEDFFGMEGDAARRGDADDALPTLTVEALKADLIAQGLDVRSRSEDDDGGT